MSEEKAKTSKVEIEIENDRPAKFGCVGIWTDGGASINGRHFSFYVKWFEVPSKYGINNGKVSKLFIEELNYNEETKQWSKTLLIQYDRGWPMDDDEKVLEKYTPNGKDEDTLAVYNRLLELYN